MPSNDIYDFEINEDGYIYFYHDTLHCYGAVHGRRAGRKWPYAYGPKAIFYMDKIVRI